MKLLMKLKQMWELLTSKKVFSAQIVSYLHVDMTSKTKKEFLKKVSKALGNNIMNIHEIIIKPECIIVSRHIEMR